MGVETSPCVTTERYDVDQPRKGKPARSPNRFPVFINRLTTGQASTKVRDMNNHPAPTMTRHAAQQAAAKGFSAEDTWLAMTDPDVTYPSGPRYPGQVRRIRGNIVAVVDEAMNKAITFYENVVETALRADQIAAGARIRR